MSYKRISPQPVVEGGTGASTLTNHGVLLGQGTSSITTPVVGTNGQVLIGATAADPAFATLTSTGGTITFTPGANTLDLETSGATANSFVSGAGTATPALGILSVPNGSNINTTGATNVLTINLVNSPSVSGSVTAGTGFTATTGNVVVTAGDVTLPNTNTGGTQGVIKFGGNPFISNYGASSTFVGTNAGNSSLTVTGTNYNTSVGASTLHALTTGTFNAALGSFSLQACTTGTDNAAFGYSSLSNLTTGSDNTAVGFVALGSSTYNGSNTIAIGSSAGSAYTTTESSNILLGNAGVISESNVIRIGTQGSGLGQQSSCFVAGVASVAVSNTNMVTINTSTGQLGSQAVPSGATAWTVVTGTSQALAPQNGYFANNAGTVTFTLPTTAAVGDTYRVAGMNNATGWTIAQRAGQTISFGNVATTTGTGGSLSSSATYDTVELVCNVANTNFVVLSSVGNITFV